MEGRAPSRPHFPGPWYVKFGGHDGACPSNFVQNENSCLPAPALDPTDHFCAQNIFCSRHIALADDGDHTDLHIEDLIHFCAINISHSADEIENSRNTPAEHSQSPHRNSLAGCAGDLSINPPPVICARP